MKTQLIRLIFFTVIVFSIAPVFANDPKNFKEVMQRIELNMSKIVGHIMREEFDEIVQLAEQVANHDEPPLTHRMKLIAELGTDFIDFKSHDDNVHINSVAMQEAAKRKDLDSVIINYGKTMQSCNHCHKKYRGRIQQLKF